MKLIGFDDREYILDCSKYIVNGDDTKSRSKGHLLARELLHAKYPMETILEEVPLLGSKTLRNKSLYADFFLPLKRLMIEVQGRQHTEYNSFHHKSKLDFHLGQMRDRKKQEWCDINNITLIVLDYKETSEEWKNKLDA